MPGFPSAPLSRRAALKAGAGTVALGGLGSLLAACGGTSKNSTTSPSTTKTDTLTVATSVGASNFDPEQPAGSFVYPMLYDPLFDCSIPASLADAKKLLADYNPSPALANAWESSADGLTWTFTLNTKAKSAAGNSLTSADILWTMERNLAMKWYSGIFLNRLGITDASQFTAVGADKVQLKLTGPVGRTYFLQMIGSLAMPIFDSTEAKKHVTSSDKWASAWIAKNATGFGPYTVKSTTPDGSLNVFEANPNYYGRKPIQTVTWRQTTETSTQLQLLLRGQAQMTDTLSPIQSESVAKGANTKITTVTTTGAVFIGFNSSQAVYSDVEFRQGIAYALPFDQIVNNVFKGQATEMKSVLPSYFQGATEEFWKYSYDVPKAKSMLAKYVGKPVTLQYKAGDTTLQTLAVLIQSSLKTAGLDIQLQAMDPNSFQTKLTAASLSMWLDPQSTPLVPDSLYGLQLLFPTKPTQVLLHYSNAGVDAAVAKLATTFQAAQQLTYIRAAQQILVDELPIIPLAQIPGIIPSAKTLDGFRGHGSNFIWAKGLYYQ